GNFYVDQHCDLNSGPYNWDSQMLPTSSTPMQVVDASLDTSYLGSNITILRKNFLHKMGASSYNWDINQGHLFSSRYFFEFRYMKMKVDVYFYTFCDVPITWLQYLTIVSSTVLMSVAEGCKGYTLEYVFWNVLNSLYDALTKITKVFDWGWFRISAETVQHRIGEFHSFRHFFCTMNVVLSFYLQPFASNKQLKL
ncbi:hypothetical protein L9F63_001773, partial [Diploptera punctata]